MATQPRERRHGTWGVFARADHPEGYGSHMGTAHGYVVIFVGCKDSDELDHVVKCLAYGEFHGIGETRYESGFLGTWYGGRFDLIAVTNDRPMIEGDRPFRSFGDNRFAGIYEADDVLDRA